MCNCLHERRKLFHRIISQQMKLMSPFIGILILTFKSFSVFLKNLGTCKVIGPNYNITIEYY